MAEHRGEHAPPPMVPLRVDAGESDLDQSDTHPTRYPAVAVTVEGIARTRVLPARRAALTNVPLPGGGAPVLIVGRADQRATLLVTVDVDVWLSTDMPAAGSTAGFPLAAGGGLGLDYSGDLWAVNPGVTAGTAGVAALMTEE